MANNVNDLIDYSRQASMENDMSNGNFNNYCHMVVGCGGIGTWLAIFLAMLGADRLMLMDADKISSSNLNRLPFPQTFIGLNKAVALRKIIHSLRPACVVQCLNLMMKPDRFDLFQSAHIIWDTTDDAKIQKEISNWCKKNNHTYIKLGYEGYVVGAYKDFDVWTADNYEAGYRTTRANVATSALSAALGLLYGGLDTSGKDLQIDFGQMIEQLVKKKAKKKEAVNA